MLEEFLWSQQRMAETGRQGTVDDFLTVYMQVSCLGLDTVWLNSAPVMYMSS